jgi:hypothetical protein
MQLKRLKGGSIKTLVGSVQAMPPHDSPWEWEVHWKAGESLVRGTALSCRQAVRDVRMALAKVLDSLPCYCILSDEDLRLTTEYYRVIEVFVP